MLYNTPIYEVLDFCHTALVNAQEIPQIQEALARLNYTPEKFMEGMNLYHAAQGAVAVRQTRLAEQMGKTEALKEVAKTARKGYMRHLKLARIAFQEDVEARIALGLDGTRADGLADWQKQANQFYANLQSTPAYRAALLPYNLTSAEITHGLAQLAAVQTAYLARETARGLALQATLDRDHALKVLKAWVSDMLTIARLALEDHPQRLEALGLTIPS
ncbi:MAG: hypothetical protein H6636_11730 [Anaerolineales bacterium]|nr:hypothetical protein [Anaerolineales bacterium]